MDVAPCSEGKVPQVNNSERSPCDVEDNDHLPDSGQQSGIQKIENITTAWSKTSLIIVYVLMWITYFVMGMLSGTFAALTPFVTSDFAEHSLIPTVNIVSSIIGGCTNFTIAKVLDVFSRPLGYVLCVALTVIGLVMTAACQRVETYAAAQVFYTVGSSGLQYTLGVFIADTSKLQNRGLMTALTQSSYMITCWLAGPISTAFLTGPGWKWAFGMFSILVPVATLPVWRILQHHSSKGGKQNIDATNTSDRGILRGLIYYAREFDAIGLLLLSAGAALLLLPFNLYLLQPQGWKSPLIICLLVFGLILLVLFAIWEKFFAPLTFIPFELLADRTILGACMLSATISFSFLCWNSFFGSYLQVVADLDITQTSYVININTVGNVICALAGGVVISYTKRFKYLCLYGGTPLNILGLGLMIYFRQPNMGVGYIVMCQLFISLASGVIIVCDEIAMLSAVSHQHIAVAIAILGFFGNIGGAIGLTVSGAIWQNVFPSRLATYLPESELQNLLSIYGDLSQQLSYPIGSPTRIAIQRAYGDAQSRLLIPAISIWALAIISVFLWRNIDVSRVRQTRGTVV